MKPIRRKDMAAIDEINKSMENMKKLFSERDSLFAELEASIAIQEVWPEAFDGDVSVKERWITDDNGQTYLRIYRSDDITKSKDVHIDDVPKSILINHAKIRGITGAQHEFDHSIGRMKRRYGANKENLRIWLVMRELADKKRK
jgi:hypothetical protein